MIMMCSVRVSAEKSTEKSRVEKLIMGSLQESVGRLRVLRILLVVTKPGSVWSDRRLGQQAVFIDLWVVWSPICLIVHRLAESVSVRIFAQSEACWILCLNSFRV
jgi:hypothetical protein